MPLNAIPSKDFFNRDTEIAYLRQLAEAGEDSLAGNVLLEAPRGMGKTELLKQLHRSLFWGDGGAVPFYYSFRRASLKASYFATDYFTRFVSQYLACLKKDPSLVDNMSAPLSRFIPLMHSLKLGWMIEMADDFQEHLRDAGPHAHILGAIAAPVTAAARSGKNVVVMLDDFHMANQLYDIAPGDLYDPVSLFGGSINTSLCPHILTGSPEGAMENLFTDNSFRGKAERMYIGPLPEDDSHFLFRSLCDRLGIRDNRDVSLKFVNFLGGNPLYIRNMAKSLRKMRKQDVSERDLWECYSYEVSQGETFFYWSSVLGESLRDVGRRRLAAEILFQTARSDADINDSRMLSKVLGAPESSLNSVMDALRLSGLVQPPYSEYKDHVFHDFIHSLYMREVEGIKSDRARELIQSKYFPAGGAVSCFEVVIPMTSDAELVAARTFDQIAKNINLNPDVSDRIQLAIIESCINATEHSGSHDKRIFLKISVHTDRLELIVESPGKVFQPDVETPTAAARQLSSEVKRGWGLKLMRQIMDDVRVERLGDRTRIILTKNIKHNEVLHEGN